MQIIQLPAFSRRADDIGMKDDDIRAIENRIIANPRVGTDIGSGVRKLRHSFRGGARVIFVCVQRDDGVVFLMDVYLKNTKQDLSTAEYDLIRRTARDL